ncbi:MAG: DNA modification methylase [Silicimonas sp.]
MPINILNYPGDPKSPSLATKPVAVQKASPKVGKPGLPKRNDLCPPLKISEFSVADLKPAKKPVRKQSEKQIRRIMRSLEAFGVRDLPMVTGSLEIIDGHNLVEAARRLGLEKLTCIVAEDMSDVEIRTLRIALNRCQERGEWDLLNLKSEFIFLEEHGVDLTVTGNEVAEIDNFLILDGGEANGEDPDKLDEVPEPTEVTVTRKGDLWKLGDHRICCGNARNPDDQNVLVGNHTVSAVFSDPPYNVKISGHVTVANGKHPEFAEGSGEMSDAEYEEFLTVTTKNMAKAVKPGGILFLSIDWRHVEVLMRVVREIGLKLLNMAVWAKHQAGMGSFYRSQHELVLVLKRPGAPHQNNIQLGKYGRHRSNLWRYAGASGGKSNALDDFAAHPTTKPVKLVRDAILDVTSPGDIVLDPFLGSGTSVLAAELCRRVCFGCEISSAYVDVAIRRWQELTGFKAIHEQSGLTFEAVAEMRAAAGEIDGQLIAQQSNEEAK